ncbi:MAG: D-alanine--poly(phosphoribitol) ligase subunit DltA [Deltaproteobacteria bacterium]|nr:D-alanine--poly(phosphoribitol) ligase subunit DltA [Deltaproteobacteria bacterium]
MDLVALIDRWAERSSDRIAHVSRDQSLTFGELRERSDALACHLAGHLDRGVPVVVHGHKQPDMLVGFLGCLKAGHPYVPIDAGLPRARIEKIVRHSRAALVLAPGADLDATIALHRGERPDPRARLRAEENVYIMYTSGSTGEPKGVQITLANLAGFVAWARDVHPLGGATRFLNQAPFSFDLSVMDLYLSLTSGGTLFSIDRRMIENPLELRATLAEANVEVWVSTPSFAEMCLADRTFDAEHVPALRCFLFCGETLPPSCVRRLHARFPRARVFNLYGPTEATVAVTSVLVDEAMLNAFASLPLGTPRPDTQLHIVDGEIVIDGPCVSPGYLHDPELSTRVFSGTRYRTGDAGHYEKGELMFGGRLDLQIKLSGYRIELEDIANNLEALPSVERAVVLPLQHAGACEALAAFVVLRTGITATPASLRTELAERVPSYMVPRDIYCRPALPMTVNGKVDRARLAAELPSRV